MAGAVCMNLQFDPTGICAGDFGGVYIKNAPPPSNNDGTPKPNDEDSYGRERVPYDTAKTSIGTADSLEKRGQGYAGFTETEVTLSWEDATKQLNFIRSAAKSPNATKAEKDIYATFTKNLKKYSDSDYESRSGEESAFEGLLKDAQAGNGNAMALLDNAFGAGGLGGNGGGSGGGGGAYTGPVTSTTLMNKADLRSTANAVASSVLGRGITDEEFQKVLKQVRTAERADPTVTTPSVGSSVTQQGLSTEGRQNIIRDSLMKGPEAEDYGKATKMMGVFAKALEMRSDGS